MLIITLLIFIMFSALLLVSYSLFIKIAESEYCFCGHFCAI